MTWTKMETSIAAKCKECDTVIARSDTGGTNVVFAEAVKHAETRGHTVTIRQVERVTVSP